jgi:hypothetical protein
MARAQVLGRLAVTAFILSWIAAAADHMLLYVPSAPCSSLLLLQVHVLSPTSQASGALLLWSLSQQQQLQQQQGHQEQQQQQLAILQQHSKRPSLLTHQQQLASVRC